MLKHFIGARLSTNFFSLIQVRAGSRALYRPLSAAVVSDARKADVSKLFVLILITDLLTFTENVHSKGSTGPSHLLFSLPYFLHTIPITEGWMLCKTEYNHLKTNFL